jgi:hypothetical protein
MITSLIFSFAGAPAWYLAEYFCKTAPKSITHECAPAGGSMAMRMSDELLVSNEFLMSDGY